MCEIFRLLLDHGASSFVDDKLGSCLHLVGRLGFEAVGRLLLNRGCPVNEVDENGESALHIAARGHHFSFLELLIDFGINAHLRNCRGRSALDVFSDDVACAVDDLRRKELRRVLLSLEPRLRTLILVWNIC